MPPDNTPAGATARPPARAALFADRNFAWLITGSTLTMLGDQFSLLALPWLVLKMTGDTGALGLVLALVSVPRALFILVGGALVDRYSPKQVLMITKYINTLLLGMLAALVFTGGLALWMVYLLALGIGLSTAFSIPAGTSMMPNVVQPALLQAANGVSLGLRQLTMFLGPLMAGLLMALFGDGGHGGHGGNGVGAGPGGTAGLGNATGIGLAFAFDAASFLLSAFTLAQVRTLPRPPRPAAAAQAVLSSVAQGLVHFWRDVELRTCFLYWGAVALLIMGPVSIALPVLASSTPGLGAAALGVIVGAHGAGTLAGMVASGMLPRIRLGSLGITILAADLVIGLLFVPMGLITATWQGAGLMLCIGLLGGFMQVAVFTWIQQRVPQALIGRAMSLFMFIFMGVAPMSSAVAGWVMKGVTLGQLFAGCGAALVALAAVALVASPMRRVTDAKVRMN